MSSRWLSAVLLGAALLAGCAAGPAVPPAAQAPTAASAVHPAPSAPAASAAAAPTAAAAAEPTARRLARQDPPLEGEDVRAVQRRLLELGYRQVGQADGLYGPQTEAAVLAFQKLNGLEADGVVGPQTGARLLDPAAAPAWGVVPVIEGLICGQNRALLGASAGDVWFDNADAGAMLRGGETYRLYDQTGAAGSATGSAPSLFSEPPLAGSYAVQLTPRQSDDRRFIGVGGAWEPQPRQTSALSGPADRARAAALVADYLRGAGIAAPVVSADHVRDLLQADLDGDGQPEQLIVAERYEPGPEDLTSLDGYSVILLQHQAGGALKLEPLDSDVHPGLGKAFDRSSNSLFLALDLNGDGRMEVVTHQRGFEWDGVVVYGFAQGRVTRLLEAGCGV